MAKPKTIIVPQEDGSAEIFEYKAPPFTREEIIAVKDYINSRNKTEEGRLKLVEFNQKYYGEIIPGYCDQACISRTIQRVEKCLQQLADYEAMTKQKK